MRALYFGALLGLFTLAACRTAAPTQYYTLDMDSSGQALAPLNLVVDRVQVSEALSRRDIMIKQTPTQIEYYATDQWAAGLDDLVSQKLQEEFGHPQAGRATLVLHITVLGFEQIDVPGGADAYVRLAVDMRDETASRHDPPLLTKVYTARKKADTERPADVVGALSRLLETVAAEMVSDAAALAQAHP